MTGVLSDKQVLAAMVADDVLIHPFHRSQLCTSSYDVRLGQHFYREQAPSLEGNVFNILDPKHVERVWGEPRVAPLLRDTRHGKQGELHGIAPDDQIIVLKPGETVLAHTEEFIGARRNATTMMKARSSLGRSFILVCKCAGWGDIGYTNRWTMEVTNVSLHYEIPLVVGMRIAQIAFFASGKLEAGDYTDKGMYQSDADLDAMVKNWRPEMMLPKTRR